MLRGRHFQDPILRTRVSRSEGDKQMNQDGTDWPTQSSGTSFGGRGSQDRCERCSAGRADLARLRFLARVGQQRLAAHVAFCVAAFAFILQVSGYARRR